ELPVRVAHTPDDVPDFQLELGGRSIAIEATKVAVPDVEHARSLQNRGFNRILGISGLLRRKPDRRSKSEVINEGFSIPQMVFPVSLQEHREIWLKEATASLQVKTQVLGSDRFRHGQEDWLLLWDRIGTAEWEVPERAKTMIDLLKSRWRPDWYSRVILQAQHFEWQLLFTEAESTPLPAWRL
ncbi:MAG: hypothetical protein ACYDC1_25720, partial [Limisphaerales bacterium]